MRDDSDPNIKLAGLSIWVEGYEFPDSTEYWDANWVVVRIVCVGHGSKVKFRDPCIHLPELQGWLTGCIALESKSADKAELPTMEPYLQVVIDRSGVAGGLVAAVTLIPDDIESPREFRFPIELSDVRTLIESLQRVLKRFPIRDADER